MSISFVKTQQCLLLSGWEFGLKAFALPYKEIIGAGISVIFCESEVSSRLYFLCFAGGQ